MRFRLVCHLVADARSQDELPAVGQLGVQFPFETQQDVSLFAPVIGHVAGAVLDHAHADAIELLGAPGSHAILSPMFRWSDLRPVRGAEWDVFHVHMVFLFAKFQDKFLDPFSGFIGLAHILADDDKTAFIQDTPGCDITFGNMGVKRTDLHL